MQRKTQLAFLLMAGVSLTASQAYAGSFALREQSTIGLGQGFAGVAAGSGGLSSMYWNPATMTAIPGWQSQWSVSGIFPQVDITPTTGTTLPGRASFGDIGQDGIIAAGYTSYQVNDRLWIGLATNTPFGLVTKDPYGSPAQTYGRSSKVMSFDINPTIAYKVTDWLSIGLGFQAMYFKTRLTSAPAPGASSAILKGDSWGYGLTAGVMITPMEGTTIGIGYRSAVKQDLDGTLDFPNVPGAPPGSVLPPGRYKINADLTLPDQITIGIRQTVTPDLTLSAGFEWTKWSNLGVIPVIGKSSVAAGQQVTSLPFQYDDGYFASIGAEYSWSPELTLRAGLGYEWSPISDRNRDVRLPDSDRIHASVGLGYKINNKLSVDFAYSHLFAVNGDIKLDPNNTHWNPRVPVRFFGNVDASVDIVSASLTYRWDDPSEPNRPGIFK
ncbi:OmpP1/FadL family transporter [Labrys sp. KB_33_2]|uniref:OmpP1/FadL family transporter n=1 Tax=Labrys sp. KB_33_2 TaxID=3237479 RepID=UPI003F90CA75